MDLLSDNPNWGTSNFGGHPVIAACLATLQEITETNLMQEAIEKETLNLFGTSFDRGGTRKRIDACAMTRSADITNEDIKMPRPRSYIILASF
jgi:hypothetical protein